MTTAREIRMRMEAGEREFHRRLMPILDRWTDVLIARVAALTTFYYEYEEPRVNKDAEF